MKTNHLMLQELLQEYHPKEIRRTLCLDDMDILALRNLRDYTVASMSHSEKMEDWDRMSAITYCIDQHIVNLGGEV